MVLRGCIFALLVLAACRPDDHGGLCAEDSDCPGEETCVLDLKSTVQDPGAQLLVTYCSQSCEGDRDCPPYQSCLEGDLGASRVRVCVDRVRECKSEDPQNGLDDDCDGIIDNPGGALITGCRDDAPCGAFVCRAEPGQADTLCAPAIEGGADSFSPCSSDEQCRSGRCLSGFCSPLCRGRPAIGSECPPRQIDGRQREAFCARAVSSGDRPEHNVCQTECATAPCPGETACVLRDVAGGLPGDERRYFVCSTIDRERLPLGVSCAGNTREGDLSCQYGLCFGLVCTRVCAGPATGDCSDLGEGFECREQVLRYGTLEFRAPICVRRSP